MEAQRKARLDESHRSFEIHALTVARAGELATAVTGHELDLSRLRAQGFIAAQLNRRSTFEEHLAALIVSQQNELAQLAERTVSACPGLERIDGDALLHRNSLISLLETLWRRGQLHEPFDLELLLAFVRTQSAASYGDIDANKTLLAQLLECFLQVKTTEQKYRTVCWENLTIPQGSDQATYVTWESADDGQGTIGGFSAQRLKWLVTQWPELAATLGERIEEAASSGGNQLEIFVWRTSADWNLSWNWPPEGDAGIDDESDDINAQTTGIWEGEPFCAPTLVAEELALSGYAVNIEPQPLQSIPEADSTSSVEECDVAARVGEAHRLTIQWG